MNRHICARKRTSAVLACVRLLAGVTLLLGVATAQIWRTVAANASAVSSVRNPSFAPALGSSASLQTPVAGDRRCSISIVKVHAKRWAWVRKTRRVHGHRVVVRRHGKTVYLHVRVEFLTHKSQRVCRAALPGPAPETPTAPSSEASSSLSPPPPPPAVGPPPSPGPAPPPTLVSPPPAQTPPVAISHLEYVLQDGVTSVYDMDHEFKLLKTISLPQTKAEVRGVTVAPSTHLMFVPYGGDGAGAGKGSVLAYDLLSEKVVWDVKLNTGIDSGQVSPDATKLYIPSGELESNGLWNVLDTASGAVVGAIHGGTAPHNTVASNDGRFVYLGGREYNFLDVYETATGKVREIGPLINTVRPFTVNGSNTLAFATATNFDGFQVSSITSGKVLFTVSFGEVPKGFAFTAPSHGIALSPDEKRLYVVDTVHKEVQVWDVSGVREGVPPSQIGVVPVAGWSGYESPCTYDCGRGGWLQLSLDGRYLFVGDSGEVIDTPTRKVTTTLSTLAQTKKSIEVDWQNGVPVSTSGRTGVGGVG